MTTRRGFFKALLGAAVVAVTVRYAPELLDAPKVEAVVEAASGGGYFVPDVVLDDLFARRPKPHAVLIRYDGTVEGPFSVMQFLKRERLKLGPRAPEFRR